MCLNGMHVSAHFASASAFVCDCMVRHPSGSYECVPARFLCVPSCFASASVLWVFAWYVFVYLLGECVFASCVSAWSVPACTYLFDVPFLHLLGMHLFCVCQLGACV